MTVNKITSPPSQKDLIDKTNEIIDNKQDTLIAGTDLEIINATTPRLPAGYTELEYSESNKSPIDNIYTPTQNTEITTTFASQTESANFIANNSETDGVRYGFYYNTYWYYAIGKNMVSSGSSKDWGIGNWITVRMDRTGFYVNGTLVGSNVNTNNFTANPSITFARGTTAIVRWRSFIVRENGVLVMNLVPAKRNSDNVVGIYDTVSNTFLTTAGTGTFTGGPEVIYPTTTTINFTNASGYTTNVGTVTSVNNTQPDVNGDVTLTIPTVNDGILTITQNGTSKGTFSANQSTNDTIALTDTTYNVFTGADGTNAGSSGLVPAPSATDNTKFLKGDGTWASVSGGSSTDVQINGTSITSQGVANIVTNTAYNASSNKIATMSDLPTDEIFIATYGTTTFNEVWTAYDAGKTVFVKDTTTVSGEIIAVLNYFEFNSALDAHFEFASSILNDYDYYTYSLDQDSIWSENTEQIPDTSGFEVTSNKVTSISSTSTDTQYPSAKVTYDSILKYNLIQDINTLSDGTIALNYVNSLHKRVVTANTTFTFSTSNLSLTNSIAYTFELLVTMSTVKTLTFPNSVTWQGGTTPTMSQAGTYYFAFRTVDAGTTWHGNLEGRW